MTDHPLFPDMREDPAEQVSAAAEPESATAPSVQAPETPVTEQFLPDEPDPVMQEPAQEPIAQEPVAREPFVQTPFVPKAAMQGSYASYDTPKPVSQTPPVQPKFDPYTGKRIVPPKPKKEKKSSKGLGWRLAVFGVCVALVGGIVGGVVGFALAPRQPAFVAQDPATHLAQPTQSAQSTKPTTPRPVTNTNPPANLSALYEAAVPSIVGVHNEFTTYNYFGQASTSSSTGTGFIISPDGEILTNYHVVKGAETLTVTMYDGTEYSAKVLGYEAESDVALIKVEATDLAAVIMGDSDALMVGEQITAIGNPLGELTNTMTVGYVSAKSRAVYTDEMPINMMQIDAAINPGNSGGPLFNLSGEVVGITTAKYSGTLDGSATIEGIGFAIPINDVLAIVDDLREYGSVQNRAYMGVTVTNNVAGGDLPAGALVQSIEKLGPGAKAGLRLSDIIVAVGETKVYGIDTLYQALRPYRGGDSAQITVFRSGETLKLTITFGTAPVDEEPEEVSTEPATEAPTETFGFPWDYFFP